MESYILRVYRYEPDEKITIIGTLQELNRTSTIAFTCKDELWAVLEEKMKQAKCDEAPIFLFENSEN